MAEIHPQLSDLALQVRAEHEAVWASHRDEVRYHGVTIDTDTPLSRGMCGVASLDLGLRAAALGIDCRFTEGQFVRRNGVHEQHVWVERNGCVYDITPDQYGLPSFGQVYVGDREVSAGMSGDVTATYVAETRFDPREVPRKKLQARYVILRSVLK